MNREQQLAELEAAVEEIVTETIRLAWTPHPHDHTPDTVTIEHTADHLEEKL